MSAIYEDGAGLSDVLRLARGFQAQSVWAHADLDAEAISAFLASMADNPNAFLLVGTDGMVGGVAIPLWFAPATLLGVELFWYCETPGEGARYREAFERWANAKGVASVQFSCMLTEREPALRRLYRRAGFEPIEIGFRKAV